MATDDGTTPGKAFAEAQIRSLFPDATSFVWTRECWPPHEPYDAERVTFIVRGVVLQFRIRCDAIDNNDEEEIRAWIAAQARAYAAPQRSSTPVVPSERQA